MRSFYIVGILLLVALSVTQSSPPTSEDIVWPQAYDEFDEHLINIVRQKRQADEDDESDFKSSTTTAAPVKSNVTKNYTIDWNEVEANWLKTISEEEVAQKWNKMESGLKNGVRSLLRTIFPQIVSMSSDAKVSGNCSAGILKWIISLRHLKGWAIKMLDAIGKPPSGLLEGAITMFGNHKECLDIRAPDDEDDFDDESEESGVKPKFKEFFRGQYCVLELKPWLPKKPHFYGLVESVESLKRGEDDDSLFGELAQYAIFLHFVSFRVDLCVPSICQREDIQRVANFLSKLVDFRARVTRCEIQSDTFVDLGTVQVMALLLMVGAIGLVICASVVVKLYPRMRMISKGREAPGILKYLSLGRSWDELCGLEAYQKKPKLATLYGLRWFIVMWIMLVYTIESLNYQFIREMMTLKDIGLKQAMQFLTNSSLQYDSLIFLSAFCFAYYNEGTGTWRAVKFLIRKYFRIIPVVVVGMTFMILLPLLDSGLIKGPVWGDIVANATETCQQNWWRNIFFIQNFFHPKQSCLPVTWIFCVELQLAGLFVVVFGVLSSFKKSNFVTTVTLVFLTAIGFAANVYEVYMNDLPPTWIWSLPDPEQRDEYFYVHMYKPWTHLSVYAIGVGAGLYCSERKKGFNGGPYGKGVTSAVGWISTAVVAGAIIFAPHDWVLGKLPRDMFGAVYDGVHRILWALIHSVMLFLLTVDLETEKEKSTVHWLLGNKMMIAFGRLSLAAYVVNPVNQLLFFATQQTHIFSGLIVLIYYVLGNLVLTYFLAFLVCMFVELPAAAIFRTRESTRSAKEFEMPKFNKPTTYAVGTRNGDIELSKSGKDHHQVRL